ncbi:PPC domain-containing protein [Myxococcota bacterium]|nr:PPC domain-containing protein [Myxococcota bacterium]MBU1380216.1 PPC domain-containing protein [Myxococcota bacterium]MBU1498310.1 PPC domain-containing protein [Myxococcota bacterium]
MKKLQILFTCALIGLLVFSCDDDSENNNNTTEECGNGVIDEGEVCDINYLGGETCASQGFLGGTLSCAADCSAFVTTECNNDPTAGPGDACKTSAQCIGSDTECFDEVNYGIPSGSCMVPCDGTCDEGFACVEFDSGEFYCLQDCSEDTTSCRAGLTCSGVSDTLSVCWAGCQDNSECTTTNLCDPTEGFCLTPSERCGDSIDNDFDGDVDCDDDDCTGDALCGCSEDELGNSTSENAYVIAVPNTESLPSSAVNGYICGPAFEDWYEFTAPASFTGVVNLLFSHASGDLDLFLYDSDLNDITYSWTTDDNEQIIHNFLNAETYYIRVEGYKGAINAYSINLDIAPPVIEFDTIEITPTVVTPGTTASMNVTIINNGGKTAQNVVGSITSIDPDVTIVSGQADFGDIEPLVTQTRPFSFSVSSNHKNNEPVIIQLTVTDNEGTVWTFPKVVPVPYANIVYSDFSVSGDGIADPGETLQLSFSAMNFGTENANGIISVDIEIDAASTVTGATLTPPASTVCSNSGLLAGSFASCDEWTLTIPSQAVNNQSIILNFTFSSDTGDTWTSTKTLSLGTIMEIIGSDAIGDHDDSVYACDLSELWAAQMDGTLYFRLVYAQDCDIASGYHDLYLVKELGGDMCTLTFESGELTYYENTGNGWSMEVPPASASATVSANYLDFTIDIADLPFTVDSSLLITSAISSSDPSADYSDFLPDLVSSTFEFITYSW